MPGVPLVETNDVLVTSMAFEHLLERGFQRFAFCGFEGANYSRRRKAFLTQMVLEHGWKLATLDSPQPHTADTSRIEASGLLHLQRHSRAATFECRARKQDRCAR
jgi:LacI family transcriptional regulator